MIEQFLLDGASCKVAECVKSSTMHIRRRDVDPRSTEQLESDPLQCYSAAMHLSFT